MSAADLVNSPPIGGKIRTPSDPRATRTTRLTRSHVRLQRDLEVQAKADALRLGLTFSEYVRVAIYAWLRRDTPDGASPVILDDIRTAAAGISLATVVARHAKPHSNPTVDMADRGQAKTRLDATPTDGRPTFREGRKP